MLQNGIYPDPIFYRCSGLIIQVGSEIGRFAICNKLGFEQSKFLKHCELCDMQENGTGFRVFVFKFVLHHLTPTDIRQIFS